MVLSGCAAFAIPMLRDAIPERVRAKMRDLAQEIDRRLLITILEFTVCRAHAAERLNLAPVADRRARAWLIANFAQRALPAFAETAFADVVALLMRDHANAHRAVGIDGAARHSSAAGVFLPFCVLHRQRHGQFLLGHAAVVFLAPRLGEIQLNNLLGRDAHGKRALRAIDSRVDQRIKLEFHAEFFLSQPLHLESFMLVDSGWHRLELKGQPSLQKQADTSHAAVIGAGNLSQRFVGFARRAVESYLDGEGPVFGKVVGDALVDHRAVGEERDQKAALLGFGVNLEKILTGENLTAAVEQPQTPCLDEFIEQSAMLVKAEFSGAGRVVAHGEVVVAMQAFEWAPAGNLDRHFKGRAFPEETLMDHRR